MVAVFVLVIVSPLALRELGSIRGAHWSQLSNIGQTYGAASALLTGLALIGVAGSIVFQVRAIRVSRQQAIRQQHAHLIEMALKDPVYQRAWGGLHDSYDSSERYRQHGYINLIVSFWQDQYTLSSLPENAMRNAFSNLFRGEAGRDFWRDTRDVRLRAAQSRRDKRFCYIMEEEYQKADAIGPPAVRTEISSSELPADRQVALRSFAVRDALALLLGVMGGIVFESLMHRHGRFPKS
jgi:hypothetical protein